MNDERSSAPVMLDYAAGAPLMRRRRVWRVMWTFLLAGVLFGGWHAAREHYARLGLQWLCMTYQMPDVIPVTLGGKPAVPAAWSAVYASANGGGDLYSDATIFLHQRRTPAGKRRLVAVDVTPYGWSCFGRPKMRITARVYEPGGVISPPRQCSMLCANLDRFSPAWRGGQIDPKDASRFTLSVVDPNTDEPHIIHGQLLDDDTVLLTD